MKIDRILRWCFIFCLMGAASPGVSSQEVKHIVPNVVYSTELKLSEEYTDYLSYAVTVPADAVAMRIRLYNSPADLDLFLNYERTVDNYDDVLLYGISEQFHEELFFTRFSDPALESGTYFFDVAYQRNGFPSNKGGVLSAVPFSFRVELTKEKVEAPLVPGEPFRSRLYPDTGMFSTFTVEVPEGEDFLRIDLSDSDADLDLIVRQGRYAERYDAADHKSESLLTSESILISEDSPNPLQEGTYYITVLDQIAAEYPIEYTIHTNFSDAPPAELTEYPDLKIETSPMDKLLRSTVEVIAESGKGSGCIVTPEGLVVTNFHVIESYTGDAEEELYVAVTSDLTRPPLELYKAEVVDTLEDVDLALLRIVSGRYGQPLPEEHVFPYLSLNRREDYTVGDEVYCAGYPGIGGTGSRASITLTRGIISGFERTSYGTLLKTDGLINSGSSGGAAVDSNFRLIGLPSIIMEESAGQLGFILPVKLFPAAWLNMIEE